jgi:hypothetical protein
MRPILSAVSRMCDCRNAARGATCRSAADESSAQAQAALPHGTGGPPQGSRKTMDVFSQSVAFRSRLAGFRIPRLLAICGSYARECGAMAGIHRAWSVRRRWSRCSPNGS